MLPFAVVKHLDVLKAFSPHIGVSGVANAMVALIFEAIEPAFRRRVIPTIPFATHRADHAILLEFVLKRMTGVLAASVGVMHQPRCRSSAKPGHCQRIGHDIRRHARL